MRYIRIKRIYLIITTVLCQFCASFPLPWEFATAVASPCDPNICKLPTCMCSGIVIPHQLGPDETPQIILLSFDDSVTAGNYADYEEIFSNRFNPNGAKISATFFVSHDNTDYFLVRKLYEQGHEIALHSITHQRTGTTANLENEQLWREEIVDHRYLISHFSIIPIEGLKGFRAPFLQMGGDAMFNVMKEAGLEYEYSRPTNIQNLWPYTADFASIQECPIGPCQKGSYPGIWIIPTLNFRSKQGHPCAMVDSCLPTPLGEEETFELLRDNFLRKYNGNRAPMSIPLHSSWLMSFGHKQGYIKFLDYLETYHDVFILGISQAIEWIKDPSTLNQIENVENEVEFKDCLERHSCIFEHGPAGFEQRFASCLPCPAEYPYFGNPYGKQTGEPETSLIEIDYQDTMWSQPEEDIPPLQNYDNYEYPQVSDVEDLKTPKVEQIVDFEEITTIRQQSTLDAKDSSESIVTPSPLPQVLLSESQTRSSANAEQFTTPEFDQLAAEKESESLVTEGLQTIAIPKCQSPIKDSESLATPEQQKEASIEPEPLTISEPEKEVSLELEPLTIQEPEKKASIEPEPLGTTEPENESSIKSEPLTPESEKEVSIEREPLTSEPEKEVSIEREPLTSEPEKEVSIEPEPLTTPEPEMPEKEASIEPELLITPEPEMSEKEASIEPGLLTTPEPEKEALVEPEPLGTPEPEKEVSIKPEPLITPGAELFDELATSQKLEPLTTESQSIKIEESEPGSITAPMSLLQIVLQQVFRRVLNPTSPGIVDPEKPKIKSEPETSETETSTDSQFLTEAAESQELATSQEPESLAATKTIESEEIQLIKPKPISIQNPNSFLLTTPEPLATQEIGSITHEFNSEVSNSELEITTEPLSKPETEHLTSSEPELLMTLQPFVAQDVSKEQSGILESLPQELLSETTQNISIQPIATNTPEHLFLETTTTELNSLTPIISEPERVTSAIITPEFPSASFQEASKFEEKLQVPEQEQNLEYPKLQEIPIETTEGIHDHETNTMETLLPLTQTTKKWEDYQDWAANSRDYNHGLQDKDYSNVDWNQWNYYD